MNMEVSRLENETEIIEFQKPVHSEKNLYVSNISVNLPEEEASLFVQEELDKAFSRFGLVHSVLVFTCSRAGSFPKKGWSSPEKPHTVTAAATTHSESTTACRVYLYAFINFYSKLCACRAKRQLHLTRIVGTTPCKIQFSQRKQSATGKERESLYPKDCTNLANWYLGFDGWSTAIRLMKRDDPPTPEDDSNDLQSVVCRFLCVVELVLPRHGLTTHGVGTAEGLLGSDVTSKGGVLSKCRKNAHREAVRNAFSRVLLVVVGNGGGGGKVHAEIDTTIPDTFVTAECLRDPTMLTVNELLEEPQDHSDDDDDNVDDNMDEKMIQILADLQAESSQPSTPGCQK